MTAADLLVLVGGILQVVGVMVTFDGARRSWNEFSPEERLLDDPLRRIRTFVHTIYVRTRALIGRPVPVQLSVSGGASVTMTGRALLTKSYSSLDSNLDIGNAIEQLDQRTRELADDLNSIRKRLHEQLPETDRRVAQLEKQLLQSVFELKQQDRHIAVSGIKVILAGLVLVGAGISVQTFSIFW